MKCKSLFIVTEFKLLILCIVVPKAKRIVYSTCSIHPDENEHVVKKILQNNPEFELATRESVLPTWHRRGMPAEINGDAGNFAKQF
jgi:putative methyltransferase